jgi:hypothetical protein
MEKSFVTVSGHIKIFDTFTGNLVYETDNDLTDEGLAWIADHCSDAGEADISHVAVGTGTLTGDGTDTTLDTEVARVAIDSITQATTLFFVVAVFGAGVGTGTLTEVGILNAPTGGTLIACKTIAVKKAATDSYTVNWTITFTRKPAEGE